MTPSPTWRSIRKRKNSTGKLLTESDEGTILAVRVIPGAKKTMIAGEENGRLKVRLQAPPVEGKANKALRKLLAGALELRKNQVRLRAGEHSRDKSVLLAGVTPADTENRLKKLCLWNE